jgi:hypothetical protein
MSSRFESEIPNSNLSFTQMALLAMLRLVVSGSTPSAILPIFSAQDNPAAFHPDPLVK